MNYGDSLYIIIVIAKIKNITPSKHLHYTHTKLMEVIKPVVSLSIKISCTYEVQLVNSTKRFFFFPKSDSNITTCYCDGDQQYRYLCLPSL